MKFYAIEREGEQKHFYFECYSTNRGLWECERSTTETLI